VEKIEGLLSGTLGFLLDELSSGRSFSAAVRDAMARGYTEPDPRDDLSGIDVGRKALILGRLLGFPGELRPSMVQSLVPRRLRSLPLPAFLDSLERLDPQWRRRVDAAAGRGRVLRYVATVTRRLLHVGLREVDRTSPFAALKGADNTVVFTTQRYKANPLVITGPGAGPAVTAAGVLNDVLQLAGACPPRPWCARGHSPPVQSAILVPGSTSSAWPSPAPATRSLASGWTRPAWSCAMRGTPISRPAPTATPQPSLQPK
jgi:aspartokinase/homoserine dehydrogenase 1